MLAELLQKSKFLLYVLSRKFYIRGNNNNVDSIETGRIVIANLLPWSGWEKCMYTGAFLINDDKILSSLLNS